MSEVYGVKGMSCVHCAMHVQKALEMLPGVKAVVTLEPAQATVEFSDRVYSIEELQSAVTENAGDYVLFKE